MSFIRTSAKAIVIRDGMLLTTTNVADGEEFYLLPGGGQEFGETLRDALIRECREELGVTLEVGDLVHVREYIAVHHEFAGKGDDAHQIEFMFACRIDPRAQPEQGPAPDSWQTGVSWLPIDTLDQYLLYPQALKPIMMGLRENAAPVYLGDVN